MQLSGLSLGIRMNGGGQDAELAEETSGSKSIKRRIDYLAAESRVTVTGRNGHGA